MKLTDSETKKLADIIINITNTEGEQEPEIIVEKDQVPIQYSGKDLPVSDTWPPEKKLEQNFTNGATPALTPEGKPNSGNIPITQTERSNKN